MARTVGHVDVHALLRHVHRRVDHPVPKKSRNTCTVSVPSVGDTAAVPVVAPVTPPVCQKAG